MFNGLRRDDVIQLKLDLEKLGFLSFKNPTNFYGPETAAGVREFQTYYGLKVDGSAGTETLKKISELLNSNEGQEITTSTSYNVTLNESLNIQMNNAPQTDKYSSKAAYVSAKYVNITDHSAINSTGNVNLRTSPSLKNNNNVAKSAKNGDKITILGEVKGDSHQGSTKWYKINHKNDKATLYVHSSLVSTSSTAKANGNVNVRSDSNTSS